MADMNEAAADACPTPTCQNVAYGPHERNVLDFWQAESTAPTPVVVFIHGGGFQNGDKTKVRENPSTIQRCLDNGVSFASINYRFREHAALPDILRDSARAIQFIRSMAGDWNIDKPRIAAYGGSAGAGTSLWLGFHDDLADPDADDPVLRESSRLAAAGANGTQATYDIQQWRGIVGHDPEPQGNFDYHAFYGLPAGADLDGPEAKAARADLDMLGMVHRGGPPVFLNTPQLNIDPVDHGHYVHHPRHAIAIRDRCESLGIDVACVLPEAPPPPGKSPGDVMLDFFFKHLGVAPK